MDENPLIATTFRVVFYLINSLIKREEKYGARYCLCRKITGDSKEDKKIICSCVYHKKRERD